MPSELVGVAGFEPAASSSRTQVQTWTASAAASLAWHRSSVSVRWRSPLAVAVVTHLVTWSVRVGITGVRPRSLPETDSHPLLPFTGRRVRD
jgi:hypothetical protein